MDKQRTLGILLFPGFESLDVFGPLEMFGQFPKEIRMLLVAEKPGSVNSIQGQNVIADFGWDNAPHLDILLVPGGMGVREEVFNLPLIEWIKQRATEAELTLSVCTGAALLAKAGVLDGLQATTNKLSFQWVMEQSQQVDWQQKARWVDAGHVVTSSGVSAGIDMSLYVISKLFGELISDEAARRTEYVPNKDPLNDPFGL